MDAPVDQALRRVAIAFRLVGAGWLLVLVVVLALVGDLEEAGVVAGVAVVAVGWAVALAGMGVWLGWWVLVVDLVVCVGVLVVPALAGEPAAFYGGYPFAALVLGLAARGSRGAVVAAAVLATATLTRVALLGRPTVGDATGNVLLYALGAAVLVWGLEVFRRAEERAGQAEAALARSEERASTAAHLHDSVLQTLALVQRRAGDPAAVRSLARRQERELRQWLFGDADRGHRSLEDALRDVAESVEQDHDVQVSVVCVGTATAAGPVRELVAAAREALVNAAVHARVQEISLFGEVADGQAAVFVRDRGRGFDPDRVAEDRQGVRSSIVGRLARVGGAAEVSSRPGRGTEVRLRVPLAGPG